MTTLDQIRALSFFPYAFHITRIENLRGICDSKKVLARNKIGSITFTDISEPSVQRIRAKKKIPQSGRVLHDYVPFFLTFKAPMVAMRQTQNEEVVYIQIGLDIFTRISGCFIADGNATNSNTKFEPFDRPDALKILDLNVLYKIGYSGDKEKSRKKAAELLVPDSVSLSEIKTLIFYSPAGRDKGLEIIKDFGIKPAIKVWPKYFFEPRPTGPS
jgi:hypothetical protein